MAKLLKNQLKENIMDIIPWIVIPLIISVALNYIGCIKLYKLIFRFGIFGLFYSYLDDSYVFILCNFYGNCNIKWL